MSAFTVALTDRAWAPYAPPAALTLSPTSWSGRAMGGYDQAEIEVSGAGLALWDVLRWLRFRTQIYNGDQQLVWDGFVQEVVLRRGGITIGLSLERLYNAIQILYSYTAADGGGDTGLTAWSADSDSVNEYGRKELLYSAGGETGEKGALALQTTLLKAHKAPTGVPTIARSVGEGATLHCRGWYDTLAWRYYEDTTGYEANEETGSGRVLLGWGFTATNIAFVGESNNRIVDFGGRLSALKKDDLIRVTGSVSNNGNRQVTDEAGGDTHTYVASTISFDPADDIRDSASGFDFMRTYEGIKVAGSTKNDGYYFIGDVATATHLESTSSFGAVPIETEAAGASITIDMAHNVKVANAFTNELPGASVTIQSYGQKIAQAFQLVNGPWDVGDVAIQIGKTGSPTDLVHVEICANSGGAPATVLASGTLDMSEAAETASWMTATMTTPATLANATTYWLVVRRAGSMSATDYYTVSLNDQDSYPRGNVLLWDGAAWQVAPVAASDIPFKLWAVTPTTTKIAAIVAAVAGTVVGADAVTPSGVLTRLIRDGRSTARDEIETLLKQGDSGGARLVATMNEARSLVVRSELVASEGDLILQDDGTLRWPDGRPLAQGVLPFAQWVRVDSLPPADVLASISPFLVDTAQYSTDGGWALTPKAAADPLDMGAQQG